MWIVDRVSSSIGFCTACCLTKLTILASIFITCNQDQIIWRLYHVLVQLFVTGGMELPQVRSNRPVIFSKKDFLENFAKFKVRHSLQSIFFNKAADLVSGLRPVTLLKRLWHRCFPENFAKFLRTPSLKNTTCGCFCQLAERNFLSIETVAERVHELDDMDRIRSPANYQK